LALLGPSGVARAQSDDQDSPAPRPSLGSTLKKPRLPSVVSPAIKRAIGRVPGPSISKPATGRPPRPTPKRAPIAKAPSGPAAAPVAPGGAAKPAPSGPSPAFGVAPGEDMPLAKAKKKLTGATDEDPDPDRDVWGNPAFKPACGSKRGTKIAFNLRDAELYDVVRLIAAATCRKFIIPQTFKRGKKITIIAHDKVTPVEAWRAFLSALEVNGMTVVPSGRFLKITQSSDAKNQPVPLYRDGKVVPGEERMVTRLIPLKHVDTQEITNVLLKLKSKAGEIIPYARTNTLIVTDYGHVLGRFLELLSALDVPGGQDRVWVYKVQFATASELSQTLLQVFEQQGSKKGKTSKASTRINKKGKKTRTSSGGGTDSGLDLTVTKIIPEERTNQLIVIADERSFRRLIEIIRRLDVSIPGEGQVHVYYLKNADAEEISGVLSGLTSGTGSKRKATSRKSKSKSKSKSKAGATAAELFEGEVKITADKSTNSLVVVASLKDYLSLVKVVKMLDIRRPQVFVEAIVMEVNLSKTRDLGLALHGAIPDVVEIDGEEIPLLGATTLKKGGLSSLMMNPTSLMGFAAAMQGPTGDVKIAGLDVPAFGVVLNAIQTNDDVNILSTPHILTTDNEEAEIKVGQNVPFVAGGSSMGRGGLGGLSSLASSALGSGASSALSALGGLGGMGGYSPYFNVQRQDVALTLKLTPQINESDFVRLQIEQTIEELGADNPGLGPTTTKRSARTVVVAKDQQTVVIGGLMRDNVIEGVEKVPFLGDIPVIGHLFRTEKKTVQKQNLLLMLTPYIVRDPSDFRAIFARKLREYRQFLEVYGKKVRGPKVPVDYRKKHGPLQEANRLILEAQKEREQIERLTPAEEDETPLFEEVELTPEGLPVDGAYEIIEARAGDPQIVPADMAPPQAPPAAEPPPPPPLPEEKP